MSSSLNSIIDLCRTEGLRRTKALDELISTLLESDRPMTLAELAESPRLSNQCDKATVFRLLQRLADKGILRRLGLHERASHYVLLQPNQHRDYIVCTECGSIDPINAPCPVHELEKEIKFTSGYKNLYHELNFFGVCPQCSE